MSLSSGDRIELTIEKPAAGGRMIARHEGQVVLVQGAIPAERVMARVERLAPGLAFAAVERVLDPSPDRVQPASDPLCGGCLYAHVSYARQVVLKAEVIADAFARIARMPPPAEVRVASSPHRGYRMRARLHLQGARVGFYREGTHELCDAASTGQLTDAAVASAAAVVESLAAAGAGAAALELAENVAADQRAIHVEPAPEARVTDEMLDRAIRAGGLTGCTMRDAGGTLRTAGIPVVSDPLPVITAGRAGSGALQRHAESFFQANRFLLPALVGTVLDAVLSDGDVLDLYAGVGLFSVSLAASGREGIIAVEGDRSAAADLQRNAAPCGPAVRVVTDSVERYLSRASARPPRTVIVDPPRTGISKEAIARVLRCRARRIVYVSCDPATMARDARRFVEGKYRLSSVDGFDLFPNTPHVEAVGVFDLE